MAGQLVHNINVVSLGFKIESLGSIVKSGDAINTDAEEKYIIKDNMSDDETKDGVSDDDSKSNNEGDFNNFFESSAVEVDTTKQAWDDAVSKIKKAQIDAIVKQPGETDAGYINRVIWEIKHPVRIEDEGLHKRICEMDKQSLREAEKELRKLILQDLEQEAQMEAELAAVRVKKSDSKLVHNDKANTNCDKKDLDNNDIESIDNKIQLTEEIESSKQSQSSKESDATKGACCKGVKFTEHIEFISNMSANDFAITNKEVNTNDFNNFNNSNNIGQTNENIKLSEDLKPEIDELKSVETTYKSELIGKVKSECAGKAKEMGHPKIIKERHLWCVKYLNAVQGGNNLRSTVNYTISDFLKEPKLPFIYRLKGLIYRAAAERNHGGPLEQVEDLFVQAVNAYKECESVYIHPEDCELLGYEKQWLIEEIKAMSMVERTVEESV